jgi:glyoxylase-like metal-dependent hydrolase (beta-lactamase superfamily II)
MSSPADHPLTSPSAAAAGIVGIALDTPFLVGPVNVWLIEDEPLTLVDTGPNTATGLLQLRAELGARGHRLEDLGRIVLTHQHVDHCGLAGPLAELSGAEVVAFTGMDAQLEHARQAAVGDERYNRALMRAYGVPESSVAGWWSARLDSTGFFSDVAPVRIVAEGDVLGFAGRELRVHHRPGHSPSDVVLHDGAAGVLIAGDHVLDGHPPIPMIHLPLAGGAPAGIPDPAAWTGTHDGLVRGSALLDLRASLRRTRDLGAQVALTGHGAVVEDVAANVDRRLAEHDDDADALLAELRRGGPGTAPELVARTVPGGRAHPYFGLCTTLGALDQRVEDGAAALDPGDGPPRYEAR